MVKVKHVRVSDVEALLFCHHRGVLLALQPFFGGLEGYPGLEHFPPIRESSFGGFNKPSTLFLDLEIFARKSLRDWSPSLVT